MKNITVIGTGYVGLPTGACFADLGNRVCCLDINAERIENLRQGIMPIYEPGLEEIVRRNVAAGRLWFTTDYAEALRDAEFVFIAVGTPEGVDGEADLRYVRDVAAAIAEQMDHPLVIVNKSTVPVGTGDWVADIVRQKQPSPVPFWVVSCPEFLREGSAISDFMNPHRIVLGSRNREAADRVASLHHALRAPIVVTDLATAEMIKYASNAFLATKISFINEIANICEALGADVKEVAVGMGYDARIGRQMLDAGLGYGGSCFTAEETAFVLNSPNVVAESLATLFARGGEPFEGDRVQVVTPPDQQVLAVDLQTGQPVLADVTAVTRRPYQGTMITLKTSMGRTLRVTADHPVVVDNDGRFGVMPAGVVRPGDRLMALCELPAVEPPKPLNLIDLLRGTELERDVYVVPSDDAFIAQYPRFVRAIPAEMLRYPDEIRQHNRMSLRLFRYLRERGVLDVPAERLQLYTALGAATRLNALIPVDGDLLRLCGYYLAEGYIGRDTGRAGAVRERVGFCFHEDEREYIDDVRRILARWGLKWIERHSTHARTTIVSSRIFAWLLRDVLQCGTRSEDKALPRLAFNVAPELRRELLRGAWSGDGSVEPLQGGRNLMFSYATASKKLADGMALLLQSIGVVPSLTARWMNKSKRPAYLLRISGQAQLQALQYLFGDKQRTRITTVLAGYQRHIAQHGFQRRGGYALLTVKEVVREEVATTVYSLETTTATLIVGSGLIAHNCFPKDVRALAYMANVHGRNPQLLQAVMEINADQRRHFVARLRETVGGSLDGLLIGVLGLAFKPNTDDMRDAPSIDIIRLCLEEGARVKAYDPLAMGVAARLLPPEVQLAEDAYELATGCDAVLIVTEWNEFKQLDLQRLRRLMRQPVIIDGRNIYDPEQLAALGFRYRGVGRGHGEGVTKTVWPNGAVRPSPSSEKETA